MAEPIEVHVAVVGRAHGLRGEVAVDLRTDEPERRLAPGNRVTAVSTDADTGRSLTVESCRWQSGRLLVAFAELVDRAGAEALRGVVLVSTVDAEERPEHPEEYYDRQLVGLAVYTATGERIGTVTAVLHLPAQDVLEIDRGGEILLVPFVAELVPSVDLAAAELRVADEALHDEDV